MGTRLKSLALILALLLGAAFLGSGPGAAEGEGDLSADDLADIERVEAYLDGIRSLRSPFFQINPDGSMAQGTFYMERPGKVRFEYEPPTPILIVADGVTLHYHDFELGQINSFPIFETPIGIMTREEIRFTQPAVVTAVERAPGLIRLTVVDTDDPGRGHLRLTFVDTPLELRQWSIIDLQGRVTTIALLEVSTNLALDEALFLFDDPREKIKPGRAQAP